MPSYGAAEKMTPVTRDLASDVTTLDKRCQQIEKKLLRTLEASGKLEDAALFALDYLERYPVGLNWYDVIARVQAALKEWRVAVEEVKGE